MKKEKTLEEALEEARKKLLLCLERGYHLIMLCANSAPPMKSKVAAHCRVSTAQPLPRLQPLCGVLYTRVTYPPTVEVHVRHGAAVPHARRQQGGRVRRRQRPQTGLDGRGAARERQALLHGAQGLPGPPPQA
eukprot:6777504-Prymnesium_polylepis.2